MLRLVHFYEFLSRNASYERMPWCTPCRRRCSDQQWSHEDFAKKVRLISCKQPTTYSYLAIRQQSYPRCIVLGFLPQRRNQRIVSLRRRSSLRNESCTQLWAALSQFQVPRQEFGAMRDAKVYYRFPNDDLMVSGSGGERVECVPPLTLATRFYDPLVNLSTPMPTVACGPNFRNQAPIYLFLTFSFVIILCIPSSLQALARPREARVYFCEWSLVTCWMITLPIFLICQRKEGNHSRKSGRIVTWRGGERSLMTDVCYDLFKAHFYTKIFLLEHINCSLYDPKSDVR
jgi:hypothetical protein